jgi:hypothetical protein
VAAARKHEDFASAETLATNDAEPLVLDAYAQWAHDRTLSESHIPDNGQIYGEYTPFTFVKYSDEEEDHCAHELVTVVDASVDECFDFFNDWKNIPPCFDLIDTVR